MTYCIDDCIINPQGGTVYAVVQNNDYANRMMEYIPMLANVKIVWDIPSRVEKRDTYLIVGYSEFA
ncbi:hypothetical protein BV494_24925 (plasmid) [Rahnella sikkimica]|uniref:Uncharacterized protein n=2 Tax=Rahnella sikkimica TaxID=1805933 RepID=A0A2L1UZ58_9GAMM|nr:hypothetical protein BV494_24925 [Rahnella sikkimica]